MSADQDSLELNGIDSWSFKSAYHGLFNHEFFFLPRVCSLLLRRRFAFSDHIMNTTDPHLITNATQELVFFCRFNTIGNTKASGKEIKGKRSQIETKVRTNNNLFFFETADRSCESDLIQSSIFFVLQENWCILYSVNFPAYIGIVLIGYKLCFIL